MAYVEHEKVTDFVLKETTQLGDWSNHYITKIFDFEAQQITTLMNSSNSTSAPRLDIRNFNQIQNNAGIKSAFNKLVEFGGNPPELNLDEKKPVSISSKNNQSQKI